jgi:hypothetical protein
MFKYGDKVTFKTFLGETREGVVRERNSDGTYFIEIDEQVLPDISADLICKTSMGRIVFVAKTKFKNWQAWVRPDWIKGKVKPLEV